MRRPELTELVNLADFTGDRLLVHRLDRLDGSRGYLLTAGMGRVFLAPGDLDRLKTVIARELA